METRHIHELTLCAEINCPYEWLCNHIYNKETWHLHELRVFSLDNNCVLRQMRVLSPDNNCVLRQMRVLSPDNNCVLRQMRVLSPDIKRIKSPERTHIESAYNDNMTPSWIDLVFQ